jgi:hypothetical protein
MGPRDSLNTVEIRKTLLLPGIEPRPSNPWLCRLSYPGSLAIVKRKVTPVQAVEALRVAIG